MYCKNMLFLIICIIDLSLTIKKTLMYLLLLLLLLLLTVELDRLRSRSFSPHRDFSHKNIGVDLLLS
jgi:hypothetical protein